MRRLIYTGRDSIWRDIHRFAQKVQDKYPRIQTPQQWRQLTTRTTVEQAKTARAPYLHVLIPGADIMAEDVTTIPAWPWISAAKQADILATPPDQRGKYINVIGLSQTYAWCDANNWTQEVEDADYDLIMATIARNVLWDPDRKGDWTPPPRAFNDPELFQFEQVPVRTQEDADYAIQYHKRTDYTRGAAVPA